MDKTLQFLFFSSFLIKAISPHENATCSSTNSFTYGVEWPPTIDSTVSSPPCVNHDMEFLYRECDNGIWAPEPECFYVQTTAPPQCPSGFLEADDFCYIFIPRATFPPKCPFPTTIPFNSYKSIISNAMGPVWVPVRRNRTYSHGFLQWTEAGDLYKTEFNDSYIVRAGLKDADCLLYYNTSVYSSSCKDVHSGICAYAKFEHLNGTLCPSSCLQSEITTKFKCFCVGNSSEVSLAQFLQPYQNNLYDLLTVDECRIGLEKTPDGKYIWTNTRKEIEYTFWSTETVFDESHVYGAATSNGWILTEQPADCVLSEVEVEATETTMLLNYVTANDSFFLTVYDYQILRRSNSSEYLIFCFTDAAASNLLYRYPSIAKVRQDGKTVLYAFPPLSDGPGNYWCEGFTYSSAEPISTNVKFFNGANNWRSEFVAILRTACDTIVSFYELLSSLTSTVNTFKIYYTLRIMQIEHIDEENDEMLVNVHITSKFQVLPEDDEYEILRALITTSFTNSSIKLEALFNTNYCVKTVTGNLTWPKTRADRVATSQEYCFDPNGELLLRWCKGDFINGAQWSPMGTCQIANHSSITEKILELDTTSLVLCSDILEITQSFQDFVPLDLYLIGTVYLNYFGKVNVSHFVDTIDNLLKIDKKILRQAQMKMLASDILLSTIYAIMDSQRTSVAFQKDNFAFVTSPASNFSGLAVQNVNDVLIIKPLESNISLADVKEIENLESAIWLSPEVLAQLELVDELTVSVFFNNYFFAENATKPTNLSKIFGLRVPRIWVQQGSIWMLHKMSVDGKANKSCLYWDEKLSTGRGRWLKVNASTTSDGFLICELTSAVDYHFFAIGVSPWEEANVTDELILLLEPSHEISQSVSSLRNISQKHQEFKPVDVFFVGKILENYNSALNVNLEELTETVSNLHKIDRQVLLKSQTEMGSTDLILYSIDNLARRYSSESQSVLVADSFMIVISDLKTDNFSCLLLVNNNETLDAVIVGGDFNASDMTTTYGNVSSGLCLSPELKSQMTEETKVRVTAFYNDSLFNENAHQASGQVFGVILPDIGNYSGPVSFFSRTTATNKKCAYWDYDAPNNVAGSWKEDQDGQDLYELVECQFWHTTHFGLLIFGEDVPEDAELSLEVITNTASSLSLFGVVGIILTAALFERWRNNIGNQILLNFSCSITLDLIIYYVSSNVGEDVDSGACIFIGAFIHYTILSEFCWMLIVAVLQIKRYVVVLGGPPRSILLKACAFAWGFPLLPVICVLSANPSSYTERWTEERCFPSGLGRFLALFLPIFVILLINFTIFVYVIYNVVNRRSDRAGPCKNEIVLQWRLGILLFFMLGITWVFGVLSWLDFGLVFTYLFSVTSSLQGFVMFLFFIVFNADTRRLYMHLIKKICQRKHC